MTFKRLRVAVMILGILELGMSETELPIEQRERLQWWMEQFKDDPGLALALVVQGEMKAAEQAQNLRNLLQEMIELTHRLDEAMVKDTDELVKALNLVRSELQARDWIMDGRGPYEWDDDRYRAEVGHLYKAVQPTLDSVKTLPAARLKLLNELAEIRVRAAPLLKP